MEQQRRQTAYKVWITDLMNNEYIQQQGEWEPNYIQIREKKVSRINLIAIVVEKYDNEEKTYSTVTIDDGSDNIQLKAWKEDIKIFESVKVGDIVSIIGKIKSYNETRYIVPEIVRSLDNPKWLEVRKLELTKEYGLQQESAEKPKGESTGNSGMEMPKIQEEVIINEDSEEVPTENDRQKILNIIEKDSNEEGMDIITVVEKSGIEEESANLLVQELLKEGEIFEIKKGTVKIIE
ncbi:hypothetical protein HOA59_01320 [archaeon]|jgi:RecG-like helicase|nr:hypothetical protein [archaeon]MBT6824055.1 hypothetical protein [archaeon]MBT7107100.1 hypothetical protein [archaeon]MBT7297712.1 hypothetical protein [archaeon]